MPFQRKDEGSKTTITCHASSQKEVFIDAGHGLFDVIAHNSKIRGDVRQEVVVQADSLNELFRGWLDELMTRVTDMGMVYADFEVFSIQEVGAKNMVLTGALYGESIDEQRHTIATNLKLDETHIQCNEKSDDVTCAFSFTLS